MFYVKLLNGIYSHLLSLLLPYFLSVFVALPGKIPEHVKFTPIDRPGDKIVVKFASNGKFCSGDMAIEQCHRSASSIANAETFDIKCVRSCGALYGFKDITETYLDSLTFKCRKHGFFAKDRYYKGTTIHSTMRNAFPFDKLSLGALYDRVMCIEDGYSDAGIANLYPPTSTAP